MGDLASAHPQDAVVAAVIFALYNIYTGSIAAPVTIDIDFILNVVAIFLGCVVIVTVLDKVFGSSVT